jgi:hypothetical protein
MQIKDEMLKAPPFLETELPFRCKNKVSCSGMPKRPAGVPAITPNFRGTVCPHSIDMGMQSSH